MLYSVLSDVWLFLFLTYKTFKTFPFLVLFRKAISSAVHFIKITLKQKERSFGPVALG